MTRSYSAITSARKRSRSRRSRPARRRTQNTTRAPTIAGHMIGLMDPSAGGASVVLAARVAVIMVCPLGVSAAVRGARRSRNIASTPDSDGCWSAGSGRPPAVHDGVGVGADPGDPDEVAGLGGFQLHPLPVDDAEVDGDVPVVADEVPGQGLVPRHLHGRGVP